MSKGHDHYYERSADGKRHPRQSTMHRKLSEGRPVYCFKSNIPHPMVIELLGMAGVDCLWLDTEHFATSAETMAGLVQAARGVDTDTVVRVPNGEYLLAAKMLDMGANGIMYPRVTEVEDVQRLVEATRYHPLGKRGADFGPAAGGYGLFDFQEATEWANEQVKIIIQVETPEAVDRVDDIAAVKGISMLFIGPGDLSFSLGRPCAPEAPHVVHAMEKTAAAARANGLAWGMPVLSPDHARHILELGGRFLAEGGDTTILARTIEEKKAVLAELAAAYGGF